MSSRRSTRAAKSRQLVIDKQPSILSVIAQAAADPSVQPDKMRALLDMQKEIMAEEARMAFTSDFIAMSEELPTISATGRIEIREKVGGQRTGPIQQATPFATYNVIWKTVKPILQRHNFGLTHSNIVSGDSPVAVRTILMHKKGFERESISPLPLETSGSKNNVQGFGSSQSYGKRYNTVQLLNLISEAPEDRDTDGVTVITQDQLEQLIEAADDAGVDKRRFCEHYKIRGMVDLPVSRLEEAHQFIKMRKAKRNEKSQAS